MPKGIYDRPTVEERFYRFVDRSAGPDACWPWIGARSSNGYGSFDHRGAHRVSLELKLHRPLTPAEEACHTCDNPPCVNPAHLLPGTHLDNMADRTAKARAAFGTRNARYTHPENTARGARHGRHTKPESNAAGVRNGRALLTEEAVREIRNLAAAGVTVRQLAGAYGISAGAVKHITSRRTWRHVQ